MNRDLETQGWGTRPLPGLSQPPMGYFKKPNGEIGRLPADPSRINNYRLKGFEFLGLVGQVDPTTPSGGNGCKCGQCGFEAKSEFGLQSHMRKHKRESEEGGK